MNERTLKLYKLAHVPHTAIDPSNNMPYETTIFSAEKFAELIVRECCDAAREEALDSGWSGKAAGELTDAIRAKFRS